MQTLDAESTEYVPAKQLIQVLFVLAPGVEEYLPAGQLMQTAWSANAVYLPASQSVHVLDANTEYVPAKQ